VNRKREKRTERMVKIDRPTRNKTRQGEEVLSSEALSPLAFLSLSLSMIYSTRLTLPVHPSSYHGAWWKCN